MKRLTRQELPQALFRVNEFRLRTQYEGGEKQALWEMLSFCVAYGWTLPEWVAVALTDADSRFESGRLKSWKEVFGKPFRKKTQKGSFTSALASPVWEEVNRLHRQRSDQWPRGRPIDESLFEDVGKKFDIGKTTVSNLYYEFNRAIRKGARTIRAKKRNFQNSL